MPSYEIRELLETELEQSAQVIRQGFGTVAKEFGLTEKNCPSNDAFLRVNRLIADRVKGDFMYGVFCENKLVGFMQLEKKNERRYEIEKMTVLPEYRHFGYGKALLDVAKEKAKAMGASKLSVSMIDENTTLKNWYTANGFAHKETVKFHSLPFTVGFMELEVS